MDEARVSQLLLGFWPARALSTAAELGVLTLLAEGPLDAATVAERLDLRSEGVADLLDALVGLQVLTRSGPCFALAAGLDEHLDPGLLRLAGPDAYRAWATLPDALRGAGTGRSIFDALLEDPERLAQFVEVMAAVSAPARAIVAEEVDFTGVSSVCDVGGADGRLAVALAQRHPHLRATTFDLPQLEPLAAATIAAAGLTERVSVASGDFFTDDLPPCEVVVLSMVLLDWHEDGKRRLLHQVRAALPAGGRLIVVDRPRPPGPAPAKSTFEALRSLHLLVSLGDVFPFTAEELLGWLTESGFHQSATRAAGNGLVVADATC